MLSVSACRRMRAGRAPSAMLNEVCPPTFHTVQKHQVGDVRAHDQKYEACHGHQDAKPASMGTATRPLASISPQWDRNHCCSSTLICASMDPTSASVLTRQMTFSQCVSAWLRSELSPFTRGSVASGK
jgi:hypothetical protein